MHSLHLQLGLIEKNISNTDLDLVGSDPSDTNTNSTTIFSDDTDDKSYRKTVPDMNVSNHGEGKVMIIFRIEFLNQRNSLELTILLNPYNMDNALYFFQSEAAASLKPSFQNLEPDVPNATDQRIGE